MRKIFLILIFFTALISGCKSGGEINFSETWARPGLEDGNSAVYFKVENQSGQDDRILSADSEVAEATEIHLSSMVDDVMTMEKQDHVMLLNDTTTEFKPGGYHVMLIGLKNDLNVGDEFFLTLLMEKSGSIDLTVTVEE